MTVIVYRYCLGGESTLAHFRALLTSADLAVQSCVPNPFPNKYAGTSKRRYQVSSIANTIMSLFARSPLKTPTKQAMALGNDGLIVAPRTLLPDGQLEQSEVKQRQLKQSQKDESLTVDPSQEIQVPPK